MSKRTKVDIGRELPVSAIRSTLEPVPPEKYISYLEAARTGTPVVGRSGLGRGGCARQSCRRAGCAACTLRELVVLHAVLHPV